jgi:hypothetical protein
MKGYIMNNPVIAIICVFIMLVSATSLADVNVLDFGAVGDNTVDNTKAFQAALDIAGKRGETVHVPVGQYRFDGTLTIPEGATLEGTWKGPHQPLIEKGSALFIYGGRDREDADPFIILSTNSTIKGLTLYYPEQQFPDIRPYPWTIQRRGGTRCNMIDLAIANAYNGIDCGTYGGGGHHLRNIDMMCARRGIYIDRTFDIGRTENVHIHPISWVYASEVTERESWEYFLNNLEGFIIGRCDWDYMTNCFVIFPKVGFKFIETPYREDERRGIVEGGNILITHSGSDLGLLAVEVDVITDHAGIAFENCQFMSGIEINETNTGSVKLTNCGFWGVSRTGSCVINRGKGTLFLNSCHFCAWDDERFRPGFVWDPKVPFVDNLDGSLIMNSCSFQDEGNTPDAHIRIGKNAKATVIGNLCEETELRIDNQSAQAQIVGNLE